MAKVNENLINSLLGGEPEEEQTTENLKDVIEAPYNIVLSTSILGISGNPWEWIDGGLTLESMKDTKRYLTSNVCSYITNDIDSLKQILDVPEDKDLSKDEITKFFYETNNDWLASFGVPATYAERFGGISEIAVLVQLYDVRMITEFFISEIEKWEEKISVVSNIINFPKILLSIPGDGIPNRCEFVADFYDKFINGEIDDVTIEILRSVLTPEDYDLLSRYVYCDIVNMEVKEMEEAGLNVEEAVSILHNVDNIIYVAMTGNYKFEIPEDGTTNKKENDEVVDEEDNEPTVDVKDIGEF